MQASEGALSPAACTANLLTPSGLDGGPPPVVFHKPGSLPPTGVGHRPAHLPWYGPGLPPTPTHPPNLFPRSPSPIGVGHRPAHSQQVRLGARVRARFVCHAGRLSAASRQRRSRTPVGGSTRAGAHGGRRLSAQPQLWHQAVAAGSRRGGRGVPRRAPSQRPARACRRRHSAVGGGVIKEGGTRALVGCAQSCRVVPCGTACNCRLGSTHKTSNHNLLALGDFRAVSERRQGTSTNTGRARPREV